jgi:hypothetical protein
VGVALAGLIMAGIEAHHYLHPREPAAPRSPVRLIRRLTGCGCITAIGAVIFYWLNYVKPQYANPKPGMQPPVDLLVLLTTLMLVILLLAAWDAIEGVRGLRTVVDEMHQEDLQELQDLIEKAKAMKDEPEKPA